jgi:hypothetical protein
MAVENHKQKRYRMKKLGLSIVALLLLGCATHNGIKQNNIKKEIYMNIKTFEEYMKQKKFVLPDCNSKDDYGSSSIVFLADNTKIDYLCPLDDNDDIRVIINTPKYPFVDFKMGYYASNNSLEYLGTLIGGKPFGKYQEFSTEGELIKEENYKQKSNLPYTTILQSLEKLGYLDLKNVKLLIGNNEKFELSYSLKSSIDIDSTREKVPKNLQNRFDKSQGVWWYTINIKQAHPTIQRRLVFDDIDGSLLYQYDYRITDASEME